MTTKKRKPSRMVTIYEVFPVTATMIKLFEDAPDIEVLRVHRDAITYRYIKPTNPGGRK